MARASNGQPKPRVQRTELLGHLPGYGRGKGVRLERRRNDRFIFCRVWLQGGYTGTSTGEETLNAAKTVAQKWYLEQLERIRHGEQLHGKTFTECAESFLAYADQNLTNEVSAGQREQYHIKWNVLKKHFDGVMVNDVDATFLRKLRDIRANEKTQRATLVAASTIKKDMVLVRLVLRHAKEHMKVIDTLPEFPRFRGAFAVVNKPTPFLTLGEFTTLMTAAKAKMNEPGLNPRVRDQRRELYAFCMIAVGAFLRVDEALSIRWRDCTKITLNNEEKQPAVRFMVISKKSRGAGTTRERLKAIGVYSAVKGYDDLKAWRPDAKPDDKLFKEHHRDALTQLLKDTGLHVSRHPRTEGQTRNAKCFRHTGISMQLKYSKNPNYEQIADWARTSPEMLYRWYRQNEQEETVAKSAAFRGMPTGKSTPTKKPAKKGAVVNLLDELFPWERDQND